MNGMNAIRNLLGLTVQTNKQKQNDIKTKQVPNSILNRALGLFNSTYLEPLAFCTSCSEHQALMEYFGSNLGDVKVDWNDEYIDIMMQPEVLIVRLRPSHPVSEQWLLEGSVIVEILWDADEGSYDLQKSDISDNNP